MDLKDKLLSLRKESGMTQDEMARALFVSRQTIYKWETGRALPDVSKLRQICVLFRVPADELLGIEHEDAETDAHAETDAQCDIEAAAEDTPASFDDAVAAVPAPALAVPAHVTSRTQKLRLAAVIAAVAICAAALLYVFLPQKEVREAQALGIIPDEMAGSLSQTVNERELLALLSNICENEAGAVPASIAAAAESATREQMTREKAAYWIYCAHIWTAIDANADIALRTDGTVDPISQRNVYEDLNILGRAFVDAKASPWEWQLCRELMETGKLFLDYDGTRETDERIDAILCGRYYTAVTFCLAQQSFVSERPLMETSGGAFRAKDKLTRAEAIVAAYRLYCSW